MIVYTYSEARQNLASLLDRAAQEGEVRIKRRDGQVFVVKPEPASRVALGGRGGRSRAFED
jgi:prevent-host-death family protein